MTRYGPDCPYQVPVPVMRHRWETLTFLHWSSDVDVVQRLLPEGLTVETYDGRAWVGLVPFFMHVAPPAPSSAGSVPWAGRFCETNVRTYVTDPTGRTGIWFLSLDAERLGAVVAARTTYRLPYYWSRMRLSQRADEVRYRCDRRWPGPDATSAVDVRIGAPHADSELTEHDHFLTARFTLVSVIGGRLFYAHAAHPRWPLRRAEATRVDDGLVTAAGLPAPSGDPLVHWSAGVDVRIGGPHRVGSG